MKKFTEKILKWWYFHIKNPVVRKGEHGGFKWVFRTFWLDIETVSGNFKCRFMANAHPYAYLIAGKTDENIIGFCQIVYMLSHTITTDQGLANDIQKAFNKYIKRVEKSEKIVEDETEEKIALEGEKAVQEVLDMPTKERKKYEREVDGRFKVAVKKAEKLAE